MAEIFYHGSSVLFDRFDLAHALEGDGKVKFGYGVYVTQKEVINGANHKFEFGAYSLSRVELNVGEENIRYIEDPDFKAEAAATVFEAGQRVELGGCDMSYAIIPAGWFTRKLDHRDFDNIEWIERILK